MGEQIKKMWYTHVMEYYPAIKKVMPLAAESEVRKTKKSIR